LGVVAEPLREETMSSTTGSPNTRRITYPDSDDQPIADNTLQFQWIVTIEGGLEALFRERPDVFVAGDLLWYPVEGHPEIRLAPDALVVFGRPKGDRNSYKQWEEGQTAPQVVFEVLSPIVRFGDMLRKFAFYERHGVEEYYLYDPNHNELFGWLRQGDYLVTIPETQGWTSPRLGVRFELGPQTLRLIRPDGRLIETYQEMDQALREGDSHRAVAEYQRAETAKQRADAERQRADRLADRLRALGIDPEAP
jgi:Uma2 family endonuclease